MLLSTSFCVCITGSKKKVRQLSRCLAAVACCIWLEQKTRTFEDWFLGQMDVQDKIKFTPSLWALNLFSSFSLFSFPSDSCLLVIIFLQSVLSFVLSSVDCKSTFFLVISPTVINDMCCFRKNVYIYIFKTSQKGKCDS